MTLAFSTSSAWVSVAIFDRNGFVWQNRIFAPTSASAGCMNLLDQLSQATGLSPSDCDLFAADIGPGSFTGVRVGVTMAKTFGFVYGRDIVGASSFDLIAPDEVVVLPSKKGEYFIRNPKVAAIRTTVLPNEPFVGFGPGIEPQVYPEAARFRHLIDSLVRQDAVSFVPEYLIDPSISVPNRPFPTRSRR